MIELFIAFGAGLISFLSPCVLPLIPGYISFISGASLNELLAKKKIDLLPLILFSLGFSFVFIIFGAAASYLGQVLLQNSETLRIFAGLIIIIFSLQLLGILNISFLNFEKKIYTKKNNNIWFSFVVGMAFGFGWTPCIGPILGSILALASTEDTIFKAVILLSFYSLGLAIPFVLSGYLMQKFLMFCIPKLSTDSFILSPSLRNTGGFIPSPTPGGVPVVTISPGINVIKLLM